MAIGWYEVYYISEVVSLILVGIHLKELETFREVCVHTGERNFKAKGDLIFA